MNGRPAAADRRPSTIRAQGILTIAVSCFTAAGFAPSRSPQQDALASQSTLEQTAEAIERGDLAAASRIVEPALKTHPADPVLHNLAGVISAQQKQFERAETHFRAAIQLAPKNPAAYENLGRLYQERADVEPGVRTKALDVYTQLLDVDPANIEALFQSGVLLALDRQFAASRAALDRLPEAMKRSPQTLAFLAADFAALGDAAAARRAVDALTVHPALAEGDVLAAVPALSGPAGDEIAASMLEGLDRRGLASTRSFRPLATIQIRAGRFGEARQLLERVAAAEGASAPLLVELAKTAIRLKDYDGALGYLAHARALDPKSADVHFLFAMVCVEQNLGREAYESMKKAIELDPDNPLINYAMGAIATNRHEPSESLPYFEKYVLLRPEDPRGHFALGAALFYSNLFDQARPELERATRSPETATGGHYFLGRIARQMNDLATARREIDRALQLNDGLVDAWAELGLIQTRLEEYGAAEKSLGRALAIDPDHYTASVNLATLYAKTKDPRKDAQMARVAALGEQRDERAQAFLRIIKAVPYGQ